jgi:hypothetical protein
MNRNIIDLSKLRMCRDKRIKWQRRRNKSRKRYKEILNVGPVCIVYTEQEEKEFFLAEPRHPVYGIK